MDIGLELDDSTFKWWLDQINCNINLLRIFDYQDQLAGALFHFTEYLQMQGDKRDLRIWGNGADFDNAILANAYDKCSIRVPWEYNSSRCFRTVKAEHPQIKLKFKGNRHNALDDAKYQALYLSKILNSC
jgi:hypothetical protein